MGKWSIALGLIGALLLIASLVPWPGSLGATSDATEGPVVDAVLVERGRALFTVKGCIVCHRHAGVETDPGLQLSGFAPDLTSYAADSDYLRAWLADPAALRPQTQMPDLDLTAEEIDALIAFLNGSDEAVP